MKERTTKNANITMPIWLIERLKLVAVAQSYERQRIVQWTDVLRETIMAKYPQQQEHVLRTEQK